MSVPLGFRFHSMGILEPDFLMNNVGNMALKVVY